GDSLLVAPGYDPNLTQHGIDKGGIMMPGTATAGEMQQAMNQGCEVIKFFPSEANGGVAMLKNIGAALKTAKWMCTGGVNSKNVNDYLGYDQIVAVGGTWMCKNDMIQAEKWDEITAICKEAVKTMLGFQLAHIGINCADDKEAEQTAKTLCALFGLEFKAGNSSIFADKAVECMKKPGRGAHGHIAIGTNSVDRAVYHLGRQGVEFIEDSRVLDTKGKTHAIYLKNEVSGFAIHLVQK
ncbi:MAG: keto-hydroxyglutarate-aldolase/keto-deoxy-phosphogluconate aldolase, partial [Oscillospiraceae bacterium]|nr:keto-hydroxyglutarate-aldolase/keto-deoxy-phosphogluconate aldolase [Oscillospiraceae bacterium]